MCKELDSGISTQIIDQYIDKLNKGGEYTQIYDTITTEALANLDKERFTQLLEKRGINHLGKNMILVFPVYDSESRSFSIYICAHNILTVENECNPSFSEKLLSLLSSQPSAFDDNSNKEWTLAKAPNENLKSTLQVCQRISSLVSGGTEATEQEIRLAIMIR